MFNIAQDQHPEGWSVQHVMVALMRLYRVIAGQIMGLAEKLRDFVAIGMMITGCGTRLNALTTRGP